MEKIKTHSEHICSAESVSAARFSLCSSFLSIDFAVRYEIVRSGRRDIYLKLSGGHILHSSR